jgi:hypothetical protein
MTTSGMASVAWPSAANTVASPVRSQISLMVFFLLVADAFVNGRTCVLC